MKFGTKWGKPAAVWGASAMLALAIGCAAPEAQPADTPPTPAPEVQTPTTPPPPPKPEFTYPLTGLPTERAVKDRPIMVMIENSPAARPQTGLDQADLVYEILAEYEVTRFAAFYQSARPEVIGPVRSIRPYYVRLGEGHRAIVVHAGWSQAAMNLMRARKIDHLDQVYGDDKYYWRDSSRKAPHNLYTSVEKVREGAAAKKFATEWNGPVLHFEEEPDGAAPGAGVPVGTTPGAEAGSVSSGATSGTGTGGGTSGTAPGAGTGVGAVGATPGAGTAGQGAGTSGAAGGADSGTSDGAVSADSAVVRKVTIPYLHGYTVVYDWNEADKSYARTMAGEPHTDPVSKQQLAAANILIAQSKHRTLDQEGRREVDIKGPGKGWLINEGRARAVTWESKDGIIRPYIDGREVLLIPGKTWVQIVPEGTEIELE